SREPTVSGQSSRPGVFLWEPGCHQTIRRSKHAAGLDEAHRLDRHLQRQAGWNITACTGMKHLDDLFRFLGVGDDDGRWLVSRLRELSKLLTCLFSSGISCN